MQKILLSLVIIAFCNSYINAANFIKCGNKQSGYYEQYAISPIEKKALEIVKNDNAKALPLLLQEIKNQGITLGSKEYFHTYFDINVEIRKEPCEQGLSMLEWAVEFHSYNIAQSLIDSGVLLDYGRTGSFASALHLATKQNDMKMLNILSKAKDFKKTIDIGDTSQITPLMIAANNGNIEITKFLLANGANVKHRANDGLNIIMFAAMSKIESKKVIEVIKFLLTQGAPSPLSKGEGYLSNLNAIDVAKSYGNNKEVYEFLKTFENTKDSASTKGEAMQIIIEFRDNKIIVELEDNETSKAFVAMLPLTLEWSDYVQKEKVTNLPKKLQAKGDSSYIPQIGDFFCYAPWGNIGIFYEKQPPNSGLVYMGKVVSGLESLKAQKQNFKTKVYLAQKEK